jgi:hypothetical protein
MQQRVKLLQASSGDAAGSSNGSSQDVSFFCAPAPDHAIRDIVDLCAASCTHVAFTHKHVVAKSARRLLQQHTPSRTTIHSQQLVVGCLYAGFRASA